MSITPEELALWRQVAEDWEPLYLAGLDGDVRPDENEDYQSAYLAFSDTFTPTQVLRLLDQIATARREGAVEALREAADESKGSIAGWLRDRADRIAGESSGE